MTFPTLYIKSTFAPTGATTPIQRKLGNSWRGRNRYLDVCIDRKGEKGRGAGGGDSALVQRETNFAERTLCKFDGWIIVTSEGDDSGESDYASLSNFEVSKQINSFATV